MPQEFILGELQKHISEFLSTRDKEIIHKKIVPLCLVIITTDLNNGDPNAIEKNAKEITEMEEIRNFMEEMKDIVNPKNKDNEEQKET